MKNFTSVLSANKYIISEVCSELNALNQNYIVVGGWSPYFLNKCPNITHPGSADLDILFDVKSRNTDIAAVINHLFEKKYIPSAKHPFQLLKVQKVQDKDLVFNVDLLHPKETAPDSLFLDVLDLNIPLDEFNKLNSLKMKSILLPYSQIFFDEAMFENHELHLPTQNTLKFQLLDLAGCFISKLRSVESTKRPRDAFDIYVTFLEGNCTKVTPKLKQLVQEHEIIKKHVKAFFERLQDEKKRFIFDSNVSSFIPKNSITNANSTNKRPSDRVLFYLEDIL